MWDTWTGWLSDQFGSLQQGLFEHVVQPLLFWLGWGNLLEDAFDATGWLLVGIVQLLVMLAVFWPLQRWRRWQSRSSQTSTARRWRFCGCCFSRQRFWMPDITGFRTR